MIFKYYFDAKKTHTLTCSFQVLQFAEKAEGVIEVMFSAEIVEHINGVRKKKETEVASFTFPPTAEDEVKHDIDFTRVRYAGEKKWIFTVINNKSTDQNVTVGLISDTANKNPLGMDIYHNDDEFDVELKANNLAILENNYSPPVLTQTVASAKFEKAGFPLGFDGKNATHDSTFQNYNLSSFTQSFLEPIPAAVPFEIKMDIAPTSLSSIDFYLFFLNIANVGQFALMSNGLEYTIEGGSMSDIERIFFPSNVLLEDFWDNGFTKKAQLTIRGDGEGSLTIQYYENTLQVFYDYTKEIPSMSFRGQLKTSI